jgi:DNA-binding transcriptional LysR family regulator
MSGPWTFDQAAQKCEGASRRQKAAEEALTEAAKDFAQAEESYRLKLAEAIVEAHADGIAWTVAPDIARGRKDVAALRRDRDIKEGVREAMQQACWRRTADRKDAQRFADWSQRKETAGAFGDPV